MASFSVLEVDEGAAELGGDPIADGEAPSVKFRQKHACVFGTNVLLQGLRSLLLRLASLGRRVGRCSRYLVWLLGAALAQRAWVEVKGTKSAERGAARQLSYLSKMKSSRARRWLVRTARSRAFKQRRGAL